MIAPFGSRPRAILTLALVAWLGHGPTGLAQATKTITPAKEQAKEKAKAKAAATAEPVDLNSATAEELMALPGIGEATARKIIDGRPHKAVADLAGPGVPARTIDGLKGLAVVRPLPTPVDVNSDPIARIETLPGIGAVMAREIIAGRPYSGYEDIAKLKGIGPEKLDALKGRLKFGTAAPAAKSKTKAEAAPKEAMPKAAEAKEKAAEVKSKAAESKVADAREKAAEAKAAEAKGKVAEAKAKVAEAKEKAAPKLAPGAKVNINKASREELDALPGIGPVKAQAILDARPFATVEDIMKVKGIKEGEFGKIKEIITVK